MKKTLLILCLTAFGAAGGGCGRIQQAVRNRTTQAPVIFQQPISHAAMAGNAATFEVLARSLWPLRYQWLRNGAEIPGATAVRYTLPHATQGDDGARFQVRISNWRSTVFSDTAQLRVVVPESRPAPEFPLKVSSNGRYLVDQKDTPFRIQGEAAWSLIANLTYAEANEYLDNRRAKGFNTVLAELMEHKYAQGGQGADLKGVPKNRNGDLPFLKSARGGAYDGTWGTADFSAPNDAYFAFGDSIVDLAAKKGMLVELVPMFLGFNGDEAGWWADLNNSANTRDVVYRLGLYIGNRYKDRRNIIWMIGGDHFPPPGSEGEARLLKLLEGIKAAGARQLWSGDWKASSLSTDEELFAPYMDLNGVYTYGMLGHTGATYDEAKAGYAHSPAMPAYLKETGYENERIIAGDPASVRMYHYYAALGGATAGAFFGTRDVWKFQTENWWLERNGSGHGTWKQSLESIGSFDFLFLGRLLDSLPWYDLVPSGMAGMKQLIVAGAGNYSTTNFVVSAATAGGTTLIAYVPPTRPSPASITVDMTALRQPVFALWFDPTSGLSSAVRANPFPNSGTATFTTPGKNARGESDWVLVLQENWNAPK